MAHSETNAQCCDAAKSSKDEPPKAACVPEPLASSMAAAQHEASAHNSDAKRCDADNSITSSSQPPFTARGGYKRWSFGGRTWKPRARDSFTASPWGIRQMEVEMGATIYRERWPSPTTGPPALRGGGYPHLPREVGAGTDVRERSRQLGARAYGSMTNPSIADRGQVAQRVAQNTRD